MWVMPCAPITPRASVPHAGTSGRRCRSASAGPQPQCPRTPQPCLRVRRHTPLRATPPSGSGGSDADDAAPPDIDQLAAFLTQQAAAMKASLDEADLPSSAPEDDDEDGLGGGAAAAANMPRGDAGGVGCSSTDDAMDAAGPAGAALPGSSVPLLNTLDFLEEFEEEGGFIAQDFAIVKLLGKLAVQDVAAALSPGSSRGVSPTASMDGSSSNDEGGSGGGPAPSIFVYAARYNSGLPYEGPVTVQLREYLPGSRRVAINELLLQQRLCGTLPTKKWEAAASEPSSGCPVVQLLGFLQAPPSEEAFETTADPADTIWMVYKFEALRPMSLMLQQIDLPEEPSGLQNLFLKKEAAVAAALAARRALLVGMAEGLLTAISFCHQRGVAHCGIGAGCVMVNTFADRDVGRLLVKLDNFGLARMYSHPLEVLPGEEGLRQLTAFPAASSDGRMGGSGGGGGAGGGGSSLGLLGLEDTDAALQRQQDLQAAALLLAEVFLVGSASAGAEVMDAATLKRLLFDVFHEDVGLFKEFCLQDDDNCAAFVEFMDQDGGAGWELLEALMAGKTGAGELLRTSRLFEGSRSSRAVQ